MALHTTLFALDIDGTLIDTRGSFQRIIREKSGITDDEIAVFRKTGGFNDDWDLTRAAMAWVKAGRPKIVERCHNLADVLLWCGAANDPGDQTASCISLYRDAGYHNFEEILVDGDALRALQTVGDVVACTGRDRWEFAEAERKLGFTFPASTVMEDVKKPDPTALLRLIQPHHTHVFLLGDTEADRRTVDNAQAKTPARCTFVNVDDAHPAARWISARIDAGQKSEVSPRRE
jgi:phosphoglycolate phosphatase-like HAD superfamily hydrolase